MIRNLIVLVLGIAAIGQVAWIFLRPVPPPQVRPIAQAVSVDPTAESASPGADDLATPESSSDSGGDEASDSVASSSPENPPTEPSADDAASRNPVRFDEEIATAFSLPRPLAIDLAPAVAPAVAPVGDDSVAGMIAGGETETDTGKGPGDTPAIPTDNWLFPEVMSAWEAEVNASADLPHETSVQIANATVRIIGGSSNPEVSDSEGSGVVVRRRSTSFDVLTADHVIGDGTDLTVEMASSIPDTSEGAGLSRTGMPKIDFRRVERSVSVLHRDPMIDLAMLRVHTPIAAPGTDVQLTSKPSADFVGETGLVCDATGVHGLEIQAILIASFDRVRRNPDTAPVGFLILTVASKPGMSGSGLFDRGGGLIGIASGNADGAAHYVGPDEMRLCLQRWGVGDAP